MSDIGRIISGGQTGADQAGLFAARYLGLKTGGWAPKGWRTDIGPNRELLEDFGLVECKVDGYPARTKLNVHHSDATLIIGNQNSPGCTLTRRLCIEEEKPVFCIPWKTGDQIPSIYGFRALILSNSSIKTLNVAGNRERTNPGIFSTCLAFLVRILGEQNV
jgi:hypothetical protein